MNNFLITFRSHPNEKHLNEEFLSLLDAKLQKSEKYIIGEDDKGTLAAHYHVVMPVKGDISHAKQVFNTKSWKMWKGNLKDKMTNIDNALDIQQVKNDPSDHDIQYTLGYAIKSCILRQKGYSNDYLKQCCDYYWINSRQEKKTIDKTWKIVNSKTAHAVIEDFCKRTETSIFDEKLILKLTDEKIFLDVSQKLQEKILASLRYHHRVEDDFGASVNACTLKTGCDIEYRDHIKLYIRQLQSMINTNDHENSHHLECVINLINNTEKTNF